ncbi:MAG: hypothetical protein ACLTYN_05915 [Dysosmobacter welbionis]
MAYAKKTSKANEAFQKLKNDLPRERRGTLIFYGEETYLRGTISKSCGRSWSPPGLRSSTTTPWREGPDGPDPGRDGGGHAHDGGADADCGVGLRPVQAERGAAGKADRLLEDVPPYCCVVFLYDTVEYKPNRTMKKLYKAVTDHVEAVEFRPADNSDLVVWIARRFKALGKEIDRQTAEYLIFTCGGLMTGLVPEIAKIGAYAKAGPSPRRTSTLWRIRCCRRRCSACPTRCSRELRRGGPHPGGSAENADRAHHDPGGFGQPAGASIPPGWPLTAARTSTGSWSCGR